MLYTLSLIYTIFTVPPTLLNVFEYVLALLSLGGVKRWALALYILLMKCRGGPPKLNYLGSGGLTIKGEAGGV
jgi:hypothetical protein